MVNILPFFPAPYPDELFYSVLSRYRLRCGNPTARSVSEELYGKRRATHPLLPQYLDRIASMIPSHTGLTALYFMQKATLLPYFYPFLTLDRRSAFLTYMKSPQSTGRNMYFSLGIGKLRQPKADHLRFCKSCWEEDVGITGEPYWRRLHQLPGVLICHRHMEPLLETGISFYDASNDFFAASIKLIKSATPCEGFNDGFTEKLAAIATDSEWILQNGCRYGPYENTLDKYDRRLHAAGFRGFWGKTSHKKVHAALIDYYGAEFLRLLNAYDEMPEETWTARITHYPNSLLHPLYHILMTRFLAGRTEEFFEKECEEILPLGQGPWPCYNPVCPGFLKDVIEHYDANPYHGCVHARFECPICGMVYHRKKAMPKNEQYTRRPKIMDYGPLWNTTLRDCLIERKMSARETSRFMGCDFYTVNRHALQMSLLPPEEIYLIAHSKKEKPPASPAPEPPSENEMRRICRERWLDLIKNNPGINRSRLIVMDTACHVWLRKNDVEWYEENSPPARYASFDWGRRDAENLEKVRVEVETLRNMEGRPVWISRNAVVKHTRIYQLSNRKALSLMPLTAAFLDNNLETIVEWRMRKITWAIDSLLAQGLSMTPNSIALEATMSIDSYRELNQFAEEYLENRQK